MNACGAGKWTPLVRATLAGHKAVVIFLLEAGADRTVYNPRGMTAEEWAQHLGRQSVAELFETKKASEPSKSEKNLDQVILERPLGNRLLQEIFDFKELERITFVRKDATSEVEAVVREKFSEIGVSPSLTEAFNKYVEQGGTLDESVVLPNRLFGKMRPAKLD